MTQKIEAIIFDWVETLSEGSRSLYPYSKNVLEELRSRGYKLGLISLAGHGNAKRSEDIKATGIEPYLDSVIIDTVKTPEIYLRCIKELGATPETTAVVDDRTLRGIKIGNQIGCQTFWVMSKKYLHEAPNEETGEPTYRINSVEDLLRILK
jgi:HAD superfamily hydrolase (TIGR01509 family)